MLIMNIFTSTLARQQAVRERLIFAATHAAEIVLPELQSHKEGLTAPEVTASRTNYGANTIKAHKQPGWLHRFKEAFVNPFTLILLLLALVSACTNIIYAAPEDKNPATVIIICVMVLLS